MRCCSNASLSEWAQALTRGVVSPPQRRLSEERQRPDFWVRGEEARSPLHISAPLESSLANKANGVCDGRGFGDGHSFTDGFGDGYSSGYSANEERSPRPNSTFLGGGGGGGGGDGASSGTRGSLSRNASDLQSQQTETPL